jgi:meso-butanediol dehydrogenase/(S,S)-butanediol dehydrogenase/diacetyl reductase
MRLQGKVCLVTGAGSGIGRATAIRFAREGATVALADRDGQAAERVCAEIKAAHPDVRVQPIEADVTQALEVEAMVRATVDTFGSLDVLLNQAGVIQVGDITDLSEADWDRVLDVNLKGVFLGCKYGLRAMLAHGRGSIINTASISGLVGIPKQPAYCASKGGVIALTRALAVDFADRDIRVNCIAPGPIDTPWLENVMRAPGDPAAEYRWMVMTQPLKRLGTVDEVAGACVYLASDDAAYVTGTVLTIDGGLTAR